MAVTVATPRVAGFQLHVIDVVTALLMHPGILFPFAKKVIFPGAPTVAVNVIAVDLLTFVTFPAADRVTEVAAGSTMKTIVT